MVARQQHVGHAQAAKLPRPGVLGAFHQAVGAGEGILTGTLFVTQNAGQQAGDRVDDHHRRHLAAGEHIVADGDLIGLECFADTVVEALVAATHEHDPLLAGELFDTGLIQPPPAGRQHHEMAGDVGLLLHGFDARHDRPGHQQHAGPAAIRPVVHLPMHALGEVADVRQADVDQS